MPELTEPQTSDGEALLRHACDLGLEGIVAKRRDLPYRSGRQEAWLKIIKCTKHRAAGQLSVAGVLGKALS